VDHVYVALDLEMTGQDYDRDDIIQIAAVRFDERRVLDRWHTPVKPRVPVPLKITRLTGLRPRDLRDAPYFEDVQRKLRDFVGNHPVVGHSVGHDVRFLRAKGLQLHNPEFDTWELATLLIPSLAAYSLAGVAEALDVPALRSHDALADAEVSRRVFLALLAKLRELPQALVEEVLGLTAGSDWPLEPLFRSLGAVTVRTGEGSAGSSIRARLLAKGVSETELSTSLLAPVVRVPPLEPAESPEPLDVEELSAAFRPGGALAGTFPGYEERPEQVEMMRAVAEAFNTERTLIVEAGTGTGKSLAYLLPAARWALRNGERVVVSTDTINLQDQLYDKDIPDIRRALGKEGAALRATLLKGRSNYLCLKRWEQFRRGGGFSPDEVRFIIKVLLWLPNTTTGDVAELPLTQDERVHWQKVCATQDTCMGRRCQLHGGRRCFLFRARQEAEGAHLIVANHSLLLSDVAAGNTVLPDYDYLVIDEAHKLESVATDQLGFSADARAINEHLDRVSEPVPPDRYEGLAARLPAHLRGSRVGNEPANRVMALSQQLAERTGRVRSRAADFFLTLGPVLMDLGSGGNYDQRLRLTTLVRDGERWGAVLDSWDNLRFTLTELQAALDEAVTLFEDLEGLNVLEYDEVLAELQSVQTTNAELSGKLDAIVAHPREEDVYWLNVSSRSGGISLHQAPLHVGPLLRDGLYTQKKAIVLTSATLTTDRSFAYVEERLGLDEPERLMLGSPFDYKSAALLMVATDMPEPNSPGYQKALL
jgi:DNA polymerase-3 subunit epsilon/ATP-dependent DNA helicase DinG